MGRAVFYPKQIEGYPYNPVCRSIYKLKKTRIKEINVFMEQIKDKLVSVAICTYQNCI